MASTVHAVACHTVKGVGGNLTEDVEVWPVPGYDGYAARKTGKRDPDTRFDCMLFGTNTEVNTWFAAIEAVRGAIGTVVNDDGDNYTNFLIVRIVGKRKQSARSVSGIATATHKGELSIIGVKLA